MIVVLSGEGKSDLGQCNNGQDHCFGNTFQQGAMTLVIDKIIESSLQYSLLESTPDCYHYFSEGFLANKAKNRHKRNISLRGKHHPDHETSYFYINAFMLGEIAKELATQLNDTAIAILFRDSDGTNSSEYGLWQQQLNSINHGFERAEFEFGVAMLPKPKSEAWLLCAIQNNYQHCANLEDLSGNDNAPNNAKKLLNQALNGDNSAERIYHWLEQNDLLLDKLAHQMNSFKEFYIKFLGILKHKRFN